MQAKTLALRGAIAVVTGAASGIGAALASALARRGCALALVDRDTDALAHVAAEAGALTRVSTHVVDIADAGAVAALPAAVVAAHAAGPLIVVNNAGVSLGGNFDAVSEADFDWLLGVNLFGVIRMTRAFLPMLRAAPVAQLVNVSSIFGIIAPPGQTAYATAKFGVRGFSEALRHELLDTNVGVTVVHPGGVATNIAKRARMPADADPAEVAQAQRAYEKLLVLSPEAAAARIVRGIEAREWRVLVGDDARRMALIQRLFPTTYWRVIGRAIERKARA